MTPLTRFLPAGSVGDSELTYVVIGARYRGDWIFVRHRDRQSWEIPAGHIEAGEEPDQAAVRELYEEAGVVESSMKVVSDYQVTDGSSRGFGRLYHAEVLKIEALGNYEIGEIRFGRELPSPLTYPEVQTRLFSLLSLR
jgi:8-oxo-dGTP diphosphatase